MPAIELNEEEQRLKIEITQRVEELREKFRSSDDDSNTLGIIKENAKLCHDLHNKLKERGHEPKHHKYMIENRGVSPDKLGFYEHFHPQEDLVKFLNDPNANDDPEDITLGEEFTFTFYTNRWRHDETLKMIRNDNGWYVSFIGIEGQCDKSGDPYLYKNLKHELVSYPRRLSGYISSIWERAERDGLTKEQVQEMLNRVGEWVSLTEKHSPDGILV